jgi:hypothetical protein
MRTLGASDNVTDPNFYVDTMELKGAGQPWFDLGFGYPSPITKPNKASLRSPTGKL